MLRVGLRARVGLEFVHPEVLNWPHHSELGICCGIRGPLFEIFSFSPGPERSLFDVYFLVENGRIGHDGNRFWGRRYLVCTLLHTVRMMH
jgi:hypothetical protein